VARTFPPSESLSVNKQPTRILVVALTISTFRKSISLGIYSICVSSLNSSAIRDGFEVGILVLNP
jgi:hypothetical protein